MSSIPRRGNALAAALLLGPSALAHAQDAGDAFAPKLAYTGEAAANLDGGKRRGTAYAGQWLLGSEVDLNRLFGWRGLAAKVYAINRQGTMLTGHVGNSTSVQEIYGGQGTRLANLTLAQTLLDGRLLLEAGRSVANLHFLGSDLCAYFQGNATCGNPTFVFRTSHFTWWPASSWAAHAKAWLTPRLYAHVGAYEVNPDQARRGEHGLRWSARGRSGVVVPYAIGYRSEASEDGPYALYEIGGWQDQSDYRDPLDDAQGVPAVLSGLDYAPRRGRSGAFARFEQQVADSGGPGRWTVFGAALKGTSGQLIEDHFFQFGLVGRGTFASRPDDHLAFVLSLQKYSSKAIENLRLSRASAGGSGSPPDTQVMMELGYGIQAGPHWRIAPNLQYVVRPDAFNEATRPRDLPNALVVGLRVDWTL